MKDLEFEVKSLKTKLDELRKAKSTTFIKHEKEFVTTVIGGRPVEVEHSSQSTDNADKEKYLTEINAVSIFTF